MLQSFWTFDTRITVETTSRVLKDSYIIPFHSFFLDCKFSYQINWWSIWGLLFTNNDREEENVDDESEDADREVGDLEDEAEVGLEGVPARGSAVVGLPSHHSHCHYQLSSAG